MPRHRLGRLLNGRPSVVFSVRVVGHLVDHDRYREDEAIVFARGDFDAVCVAQRQPVLRYTGDRIVSAAKLVLVVQDVPLGDDVLVPLHVDRELVAERREPRLADRGDGGAHTQDVHALAQGELLLADRRHLVALQILQHEGIAQAHDLPVDPEDRVFRARPRCRNPRRSRRAAAASCSVPCASSYTTSPASLKRGMRKTAVPPMVRSPKAPPAKLAMLAPTRRFSGTMVRVPEPSTQATLPPAPSPQISGKRWPRSPVLSTR